MVQTLQATEVTLRTLIDRFGLVRINDQQFFREWQEDLPEITEADQQFLDRIKASYLNLLENPPLLERAVQLVIVSPLLFLAGFYQLPFQIKTEHSIEVEIEDEGVVVRGLLDILILKQNFWLRVVESKRLAISIDESLAQLLAHMLANSDHQRPCYGLITNGASFLFVKLIQQERPCYAMSDQFNILNQTNGLENVFRILKRIGQL